MRPMAYFVTGATGFIGRRLVAELIQNRRGPIYVLVRPGSEHKLDLFAYQWGNSTRIKAVPGELTSTGLGVDPNWIADHRGTIKHFFHLAAVYDMTASKSKNDRLNIGGTRHALQLAKDLAVSTFHQVSSIAVAGEFAGRFDEQMFDEGQKFPSDYHRTKFESEKIVRESAGLSWRIYRPAVVVGDSTTGEMDKIDGPYYFFTLLKRMRDVAPQWLPIFGAGMGSTNLVPVDYVVQAMNHLSHKPGLDGRVFHLVNPTPQSNLDVLNQFAKAAKSPRISISVDERVTGLLPTKLMTSLFDRATASGPGEVVAKQTLGRLGVPAEIVSHIAMPTVYDSTETQQALDGSGVILPKLASYAPTLWDFWEQNLDPDIRSSRADRKSIKGKTVVITGATSGIGKATALRVAALGGTAVLVARGAENLARTKSEIEAQGGKAYAYPCDLADLEAIDALTKKLTSDLDRIDFVVNNAGRSIRRSLRLSHDRFHDFERTMQLNYFGAIRLLMGLIPSVTAAGGAHIVNISSIGVQTNPPRFAAYVASKAALDAWSNVVSSELVGDNVTFTSIHMPLVKTPMIAPTKIYDAFPTITPAQAADLVLKAMRERPHEINTLMGTAGEISHALAPHTAFRVLNQAYKIFPDSAAARGEGAGERVSKQQRRLARILKGVHW